MSTTRTTRIGMIGLLRIENAVQAYDFWLELRGARWRQRRELRRELRVNLKEAAADVGVTQALFNIGSPKQLAYAVTEEGARRRPRWSLGAMWAAVAFGVVLFSLVLTSIVFLEGVLASGVVDREVRGEAFPWVGVEFIARVDGAGQGFAAGAAGGQWHALIIPAVVFLLVAQPWRLLRRSPDHVTAGA